MRPLGLVAATLLLVSPAPASTSSLPEPAPHETLADDQLIRSLQDPAQRNRAYYELWRRAHRDKDGGFEAFLESHYDVEVVTCPQEQGQPPIYLVLHGFIAPSGPSSNSDYTIASFDRLFPPRPRSTHRSSSHPAIDAFTADGKWIEPFGGNNVLDGLLADINGDGLLERVETTNYGIDGVKNVEVLEISTVKPKAQPLLAVLINWGADEWTYRIGERDDHGLASIELGPRTGDGLMPKAVFRWDAQTGAFIGPQDKRGDHFSRLAPGDIFKQLEAAKAARLKFPEDPDFKPPVADTSARTQTKPSPPPSAPYRRESLAELSDTELLRRMGPGRRAYEFERASVLRNHVPPNFWAQDPKRAALALVEAHRTGEHRAGFQLAIDDRDGAQPPGSGSVATTYASSRCYNAVDEFYFLRFDPAGSYLAYASSSAGGAVFYNMVHDRPVFDLRLCPLSYEEAHHLAATLWWLDRVRSRSIDPELLGGFRMTSSTADGSGALTFRDEAGTVLWERTGTRWAAELSERWNDDYNHAVFVNFACYLATRALPEHLGNVWTDSAPRDARPAFSRHDEASRHTPEELRHLADLTTRFLADFSPSQNRTSHAMVATAADAAGVLGFAEAKPSLEKILAALPEPKPMRTYDEVYREVDATRQEHPENPEQRAARDQKLKTLEAEQDAILRESGADSPRRLREVVSSSLRKLATADNPEALYTWALAREPGSQWALQRLSRADPGRYVRALEAWMNQAEPRWARQYFDEIARVNPARATEIAAARPTDRADALTVSSFSILHQASQLTDEQQRVIALLAVFQNPKSGWEQRGKAIALLVPPDEPMRYPQTAIDDALLHALDPDQADDVVNFTPAEACRALALRRRTETFDRMEKFLRSSRDSYIYGRILEAAALLAQADPERLNPRLLKIVKPELAATNKQMNEILWTIWAADLRSLGPKLEQLGTSGPDDYEDERAWTSGGEVAPVKGRFHLARKIADLWNATDPVTQIRLLTAFALETSYSLTEEPEPARIHRLKASLRQATLVLTPPQRERLDAFFQTMIALPTANDDTPSPEVRRKLVQFVKTTILAEPIKSDPDR